MLFLKYNFSSLFALITHCVCRFHEHTHIHVFIIHNYRVFSSSNVLIRLVSGFSQPMFESRRHGCRRLPFVFVANFTLALTFDCNLRIHTTMSISVRRKRKYVSPRVYRW